MGNLNLPETNATTSTTTSVNDDGVAWVGQDKNNIQLLSRTSTSATPVVQEVNVTASCAGVLDAWVDWNGSGVWGDQANETLTFYQDANCTVPYSTQNGGAVLAAGTNVLYFQVPTGLPTTSPGSTWARFRFSTTGLLSNGQPMTPNGESLDGEVEDYPLSILSFDPVSISGTVYEDLKGDDTPTTINNVNDVLLSSAKQQVVVNLWKLNPPVDNMWTRA